MMSVLLWSLVTVVATLVVLFFLHWLGPPAVSRFATNILGWVWKIVRLPLRILWWFWDPR